MLLRRLCNRATKQLRCIKSSQSSLRINVKLLSTTQKLFASVHSSTNVEYTGHQEEMERESLNNPFDVFTGEYERNQILTADVLELRLKRQLQKMKFANKIENKHSILSKKALSERFEHPKATEERLLRERDVMSRELSELFQNCTNDPNISLNADICFLFMQLFYNLMQYEMIWTIYNYMEKQSIRCNADIYAFLTNICRIENNIEKGKQIYYAVKNFHSQENPLLCQHYWDELFDTLISVDNKDPLIADAFNHMIETGSGMIDNRIAKLLISLCNTWEQKMDMFELISKRYAIGNSHLMEYMFLSCESMDNLVQLLHSISQLSKGASLFRTDGSSTLKNLLQIIFNEMENAESEEMRRQLMVKMMSIYDEIRSQDIIPNSKALSVILSAFGLMKNLPYMWMVYRKIVRAKWFIDNSILLTMLNSSVFAKNISSALRVVEQIILLKKKIAPHAFTPLLQFMSEEGDRRVFPLYVSLASHNVIKPGLRDHEVILQELFKKLDESKEDLRKVAESVESATGITLTRD
jgi:hypothetical protein